MSNEENVKVVRKTVSDEDFVIAYRDSKSMTEVAEKTGLKLATVIQKTTRFRKLGVPLPRFDRKKGGRKKVVDVVNLKRLLEQI